MSLDDEAVKKLIRAGEIARRVREEAARRVKPGMKYLELADYVERRIRELGGEPAFPTNIGVNHVAAHYTPVVGDDKRIPDNSVVKIDLGVHVDGYIADTAVTVSFNPAYEGLLEASRKALEAALEEVKPGVRVNVIGRVIENTIRSMGYKPIKNLSGHSIGQYMIHSGKSIPNYNDLFTRWKLVDGVYAIEPFATDGVGLVYNGDTTTIYSIVSLRGRLSTIEKRIVNRIWMERKALPFCERWYVRLAGSVQGFRNIIQSLTRKHILHGYPILIEKGHGMVSQFEHTFIIYKGEVIITTK